MSGVERRPKKETINCELVAMCHCLCVLTFQIYHENYLWFRPLCGHLQCRVWSPMCVAYTYSASVGVVDLTGMYVRYVWEGMGA